MYWFYFVKVAKWFSVQFHYAELGQTALLVRKVRSCC